MWPFNHVTIVDIQAKTLAAEIRLIDKRKKFHCDLVTGVEKAVKKSILNAAEHGIRGVDIADIGYFSYMNTHDCMDIDEFGNSYVYDDQVCKEVKVAYNQLISKIVVQYKKEGFSTRKTVISW